VPLPSWEAFSETDPLDLRAYEQLVVGVSTRKDDRSLEPMGEDVESSGTSKSALSRRFIEATDNRLAQLMHRLLNTLSIHAMMIDGIRMGQHLLLVAFGIDEQGNKHVLGLAEGATENSAVCTQLLTNLRDRGLAMDKRAMLVIIDGAKALRKSVREVFGRLALVQRCQEHKKRNVTDHPPIDERCHSRENACCLQQSPNLLGRAGTQSSRGANYCGRHPGAAASLLEGSDETLTVVRLNVSDELRKSLSTTNLIENLMGSIRRMTRNVDRWQGGGFSLGCHRSARSRAQIHTAKDGSPSRSPPPRFAGSLRRHLSTTRQSTKGRLITTQRRHRISTMNGTPPCLTCGSLPGTVLTQPSLITKGC